MVEKDDSAVDALLLSQLGKAFGDRLNEERTALETALAERENTLARLEAEMGAALAEASEREQAAVQAAKASMAERDATTAELADARAQAQAAEEASMAVAAARDVAEQALEAEASRLKLVHQAQVEALYARHREAEAGWQKALAEARARIEELETYRDEAQAELATLREQLRALAQEATEARFGRGEAEAALQAQKERCAALEAAVRGAEANLREAAERERRQAADLTRAFEAARLDSAARVSEAQAALARADERIAALTRSARAREAMMLEAREEARVQAQIDVFAEKSKGDQLAYQVRMLELMLATPGRGGRDVAALLGSLRDGEAGRPAVAQSVDDAVRWLATHAVPALESGNDVRFEALAASQWTDETWVAAAYRWLLGRPADQQGRAHYLNKLSSAMTRREVLIDLACSHEARARLDDGTAIRAADDRSFVRAAYSALLDRGADTGGLEHYLARLDGGMSRGQVLLDLARSAEAREAATPVGSAILAIRQCNLRRSRLRHRAGRALLRRLPAWRQAWEAGRLASLQCEIALAHEASAHQLSEIGRQAELRRVASARNAGHGGQVAVSTTGSLTVLSHASAAQPPLAPVQPDLSLGETSHERQPGQIVGLIRRELAQLGLN